ncbi:unnamed protein product [Didymodactylos carnosus]|uniref:Glutaredoxin-like protein n=1 Tax=Didymodactylos carnosus TaxID=1234261 RepID=A0A815WID8_9BILA|nr:unnamed protein product [Didymodactylos carnosus]CAF1545188.1 unnamed protein product [Didymodactylos carnosus]CAF4329573.1 unnamed protein product [Didymodactylos carnosus]CAF4405823.1 unnamed protein product [Didymodactylos carnosus]
MTDKNTNASTTTTSVSTSSTENIKSLTTTNDFDNFLSSSLVANKLLLVHIELENNEVCKTLNDALLSLIREPEFMHQLQLCRVNADHEVYDLLNRYNVTSAPTILLIHKKQLIDRVDGFNQSELIKKVKLHLNTIGIVNTTTTDQQQSTQLTKDTEQRIQQLLNRSPIILFMKGTPTNPQCGFSRQACHILDENNIKFDYFDILSDTNLREQLKKYSNWPTYPQLYMNGELLGGLDIMKQMIETGDFQTKVKLQKTEELITDSNKQLERLINQAPVMLFIKGTKEQPQCGFTKELFEILSRSNITNFKTFNILENEDVRQNLKTYSKWPTYPQVYVNGEFIGGLDIIKQLNELGTLNETLNSIGQPV